MSKKAKEKESKAPQPSAADLRRFIDALEKDKTELLIDNRQLQARLKEEQDKRARLKDETAKLFREAAEMRGYIRRSHEENAKPDVETRTNHPRRAYEEYVEAHSYGGMGLHGSNERQKNWWDL